MLPDNLLGLHSVTYLTQHFGLTRPKPHLDSAGTLTPIVSNPDLALMSEPAREAVRRVAQLFPTAVISGRGREKVQQFVRLAELYYAGSHGMDIVGPQVRYPYGPGGRWEVGGGGSVGDAPAAQDIVGPHACAPAWQLLTVVGPGGLAADLSLLLPQVRGAAVMHAGCQLPGWRMQCARLWRSRHSLWPAARC